MIDVQEEVKDALRDGTHKKNYKFEVQEVPEIPAGYYEVRTLAEGEKFTIPTSQSYKFFADSPNAFTGVTTWVDDEPTDLLNPDTTSPTTEASGYYTEGEVISVGGFSGITRVSVQNYFETVPGKEAFTIDNNNLVKESVSIDERMCSGDILKYGLCEGSSLEFQYFDKENIKGRRIKASIEMADSVAQFTIAYSADMAPITITQAGRIYFQFEQGEMVTVVIHRGDTAYTRSLSVQLPYGQFTCQVGDTIDFETLPGYENWILYFNSQGYKEVFSRWSVSIPMGYFTVEKCSRQVSTGIIKATCYNKLQSDYLDAKANEQINELISEGEDGLSSVSIYYILEKLLGDYAVDYRNEESAIAGRYDGTSSYNAAYVYAYGEGGYYNVFYISKYFSVANWSRDNYYRFTAEIAGLTAKIKALCEGKYVNATRSLFEWVNARIKISYVRDGYAITPLESFLLNDESITSVASGYHTNIVDGVNLWLPVVITHTSSPSTTITSAIKTQMDNTYTSWINDLGDFITIYKNDLTPAQAIRITNSTEIPDVTLRDLQSAVYETQCQFGQLDRETDLFSGIELGSEVSEAFVNNQIDTLWADENNVRKWKYLIITYKGLDGDGNETEYTLQRTVNADGTDNYNCSDNWLFRNLVWTEQQIGLYASAMVAKMQGITWFPFEMWAAGLPYLETGDKVEMTVSDEDYTSYILQRQLKGIQNLQDTYINGTLDIY